MKATLHPMALRWIAESVGLGIDVGTTHGRYTNFRLRLGPKRADGTRQYQRMSAQYSTGKSRRVNAVCYHGHYAFMRQCFAFEPDTTIVSQLARYDGQRDFQIKAPEVGYGRPPHTTADYVPGVHGQAFLDACTCTESEREDNGGC